MGCKVCHFLIAGFNDANYALHAQQVSDTNPQQAWADAAKAAQGFASALGPLEAFLLQQLSQDDPQQSMPALFSGFAHKAIYHPYIEHLPKPAKHEKQSLQQSLHLKRELIITKKL